MDLLALSQSRRWFLHISISISTNLVYDKNGKKGLSYKSHEALKDCFKLGEAVDVKLGSVGVLGGGGEGRIDGIVSWFLRERLVRNKCVGLRRYVMSYTRKE